MRCEMNKFTLIESSKKHIGAFDMEMELIDLTQAVSFWCQSPLVSLAYVHLLFTCKSHFDTKNAL